MLRRNFQNHKKKKIINQIREKISKIENSFQNPEKYFPKQKRENFYIWRWLFFKIGNLFSKQIKSLFCYKTSFFEGAFSKQVKNLHSRLEIKDVQFGHSLSWALVFWGSCGGYLRPITVNPNSLSSEKEILWHIKSRCCYQMMLMFL